MTHEIVRHLLDDYVTGDLDPDASDAVRTHTAACAICHAEVEGLRRVLSGAAQLPKSIDPPVEAWGNIRSAILRQENGRVREVIDGPAYICIPHQSIKRSHPLEIYCVARSRRSPDCGIPSMISRGSSLRSHHLSSVSRSLWYCMRGTA